MLDKLGRIASANQHIRREQIVAILEEIDVPFARYRSHAGRLRPENITVRFGNAHSRLVLCAHYDSVEGSTGANDNASGVCILLELIQRYSEHPPDTSLEFVFFDLEEREFAGSWAYVQQLQLNEVWAAINLDLCGVGDTVIIAPAPKDQNSFLSKAIQQHTNQSLNYPVKVVEGSLPGDQMAFEHVGIPAIMVSVVPYNDVSLIAEAAQQTTSQSRPSVFETMHNGPRDSIAVIQEEAMKCVLDWVDHIVQNRDS